MPEPRTTPNEHDVPVFQPGEPKPFQPGKPTPDDPSKESPMNDPPVHPEHDIERAPRVGGDSDVDEPRELGGIDVPDSAPDRILYDESRVPG